MEPVPEWIKAYSSTVIKIRLRQTKGSPDPKELLPPSLRAFEEYLRERVTGVVRECHDDTYQCMFCKRKFASRKGIYLHLIRKHQIEMCSYLSDAVKEIESYVKKGAL